jgi:hypothetical protein
MSGAIETSYPGDPSERSPFVGRGAELQQLCAA